MEQSESLKIRPYARLLTMLGDQLIKNETIALLELVKNAYDADAEHVTISLENFNNDGSANEKSSIIIDDDGNGMNADILKNAWMNPATPEKYKRKRENAVTDKGRIMQGEKGIGRFAIFKLGKRSQIITRRQKQDGKHFIDEPESENEFILTYDFSEYDNDFLIDGEGEKEVFLEDLNAEFKTRPAETIIRREQIYGSSRVIRKPYGTKIIIDELKGKWDKEKIEKIYQSILRMQPIFGSDFESDFKAYLIVNGKEHVSEKKSLSDIRRILDDKSVFIIDGCFDAERRHLIFQLDNHDTIVPYDFALNDPEMLAIGPLKPFLISVESRELECGSFSYKFYIMDLDVNIRDQNTRFYLDKDEKESIKSHRVYLYRDGIRVMPYGDQEDDWLLLDTIRGIEKSGRILGNDQIVGYISITQKDNPGLKDKTNREGLIEEGYAKDDLIKICQLLLRYLRAKPYAQYLIDKKNRKNREDATLKRPMTLIENAKETQLGEQMLAQILDRVGDTPVNEIRGLQKTVFSNMLPKGSDEYKIVDEAFEEAAKTVQAAAEDAEKLSRDQNEITKFLSSFESAYKKEVNVLESRIATTENLAAIGLSAETAYHDARILLSRTDNALGNLIQQYKTQKENTLDRDAVTESLEQIKTQTAMVSKLMNNVQRLFPSARNKKCLIDVFQVIRKVIALYSVSLEKNGIDCSIEVVNNETLRVESTDAVLLQVFINLIDNSLYWLKTVGTDRKISIMIEAKRRSVMFSDSGPGVRPEDSPYIFEAFYSGKGEEGKGLGLYIARQLLERYNATINLITNPQEKRLRGANFLICFKGEDNDVG